MRNRMMLLLLVLALPALAQWQTDYRLTNEGHESYTTNNNAWAVAANGNTVHVVWFDNRDGNYEIYYKRSTDAGANWLTDTRLTSDAAYSFFPAVAFDGDTVHVVWQDYRDGYYQTYYKRSTNAGVDWGSDTRLSITNYKEAWTPSLAVSGSNVWVVWSESVAAGNYEVYYRRSTDRGGSWGSVGAVSSSTKKAYLPSVAASGSYVHFAWQDNTQDVNKFMTYYNRYNGSAWKGPTALSTKGTYYSLGPCVAAYGANVMVAWDDNRKTGGKWNILSRRSTNNGNNWDAADVLFTDNNNLYTELPNLAFSGTNAYAVWSVDSAGSKPNFEIHCNNSTDAGANWIVDRRLTTAAGYSEYPSVAVSGNYVHVVWQDDRVGNYEIYYKRCDNPSNLGWFTMTSPPSYDEAQSWLVYNPSNGYVYLSRATQEHEFTSYDTAAKVWTSREAWVDHGSGWCGCANGSGIIYAAVGSGKVFCRYTAGSNTWDTLEPVPGTVALGGGGGMRVRERGKYTQGVSVDGEFWRILRVHPRGLVGHSGGYLELRYLGQWLMAGV